MTWFIAAVAAVIALGCGVVIGRASGSPDVPRDERPPAPASVWVARVVIVLVAVANPFTAFAGFLVGAGIGVAWRLKSERAERAGPAQPSEPAD